MFTELQIILTRIRTDLERLRNDEHGYTTETVVVTAVLVAVAIAVSIIGAKIIAKANGIDL